MRISSYTCGSTYIALLLIFLAVSVAKASGAPSCIDDECVVQKEFIFAEILKPIVHIGKIPTEVQLKKIFNYNPDLIVESTLNGGVITRWPSWGLASIEMNPKGFMRINFSIEQVCIRRAEVEKAFPEPWLVAQTPGRWFDRKSSADKPHDGAMSYREGESFSFVFGFQPSGCAHTFFAMDK